MKKECSICIYHDKQDWFCYYHKEYVSHTTGVECEGYVSIYDDDEE